MKAIFTGASGLLGSACRVAFERAGIGVASLARDQAWDTARTRRTDGLAGADLVVHAAANTNVEQCELDQDACYRDNFLLTEGLAVACADAGLPLVYISSTGVYGDAQDAPYREYSEVRPTTHHHRAKWLGEQAVMAAAPGNLVIRTGWLFGGSFENPKNFIARRLEEAAKAAVAGQAMFSNSEQRGCPTFTTDVADRLLLLIRERQRGLFNVVNEGNASRLEYVRAIVSAGGRDVPVEPVSAASFNRRAKVSANEMALNWRARELGFPEMPNWQDSLNRYVHEQRNINRGPSHGN